MKEILKKLKTTVSIENLISYYETLNSKYQHLLWSPEIHKDDILEKWQNTSMTEKTQGWGIQSNLEDLSIPCPPFNITKHKTVEYRNTELVFGVVKDLVELFPYAYRWALTVQLPAGKVSLHSDNTENLTVWIPITNPPKAHITFVESNIEHRYCFPADGSLYLLDTSIPHYTYNDDNIPRAILSFRVNVKYKELLLSL